MKKSKASQDQAKKATRKNSHCCMFSRRTSLMGFGALAIGGFKVEIRVAKYLLIPSFSGRKDSC